jgi:hypothetical protein
MRYDQTGVIGGRGPGPGEFGNSLTGIAVDRQDHLYATGDAQVQVYDGTGRPLRRWKTSQPATAIAVAPNGHVFVGEAGQIEMFDGVGTRLGAWRDAELFGEVTSIGFWRDNVFAADAKARSIRRLDKTGKLINSLGADNRLRGFLIPNGTLDFSVDAKGVVHSANPGKHRVEQYQAGGELLGHIGHFDGVDPSGFPGCCNPTNVHVGPNGWVYVTEKAGPRAKLLGAGGELQCVISDSAFDPMAKNMPIAVDSRGRVFVGDTARLRIVVFEPAA